MTISVAKAFQKKRAFSVFAVIIGIILVSTSIYFSLQFAKQQAIAKETNRLKYLTGDVLERMLTMRMQFSDIVKELTKVPPKDACSGANVKRMQQLDVSAFFIQAIGHISNNIIDCSSLPSLFNGINLGQPNTTEPSGTRIWAHIPIPDWEVGNYVLLEKDGYVAAIVPRHSIEALGNPEVSVAIFGIKSHIIYTSRGLIKPEWIKDYQGKTTSFIDREHEYIVYIAPNKTHLSAVVTAMPISEIADDVTSYAKILMPMGILLGLGLAVGFLYLARRRYSAKAELLKALDRNEFYLEYQPIIDLRTKKCVGAEALIRWRSPDGSHIRPDLFIPIAEETGVITQLTQRVFKIVANELGETIRENPHFHIGINVSSLDLQSSNLLDLIKAFIQDTGIDNSQLMIEATERGFLNDGVAKGLMESIRSLGVQIAIDDFGTGYSSLSYLTKFDLDYLKIDKTFVDVVGTEAVTGHVAFHIIEMAKSLNLTMIAEGVETENQATILLEHGVTFVQGWLFAKSLAETEFLSYLEKHLPDN